MEGELGNYKDWEQQDDGYLWNTAEISIYNNSGTRIIGVPFIARQTFDGDGNIRSGNLKPDYLRAWVGTTATLLSPYPTTWDLFGPAKTRPDVTVTASNNLAPGQYHAWLRVGNGNCRERNQLGYFQVGSPADLRIKKNAPSTAFIGGQMIYRIDYSNVGRGEA